MNIIGQAIQGIDKTSTGEALASDISGTSRVGVVQPEEPSETEENTDDKDLGVDKMSEKNTFSDIRDNRDTEEETRRAKREEEKRLREVMEEGYKEGFTKGLSDATATITKKIDLFDGLINEVEQVKKTVLKNAQENFYTLSKALCESLLDRQIDVNKHDLIKIIDRAVKETNLTSDIKVYLSSSDYDALTQDMDEALKERYAEDGSLEVNSFRVESGEGVIDSSVNDAIRLLLDQADLRLFGNES